MPITTTPSGGPQGEFSTYTPIYSTTLSSATASITLSNIPTTFTDLVMVTNFGTSTNGPMSIQVNGDTSNSYSRTCLYGDGTSAASFRESNQAYLNTANGYTTMTGVDTTHFINYSNPSIFKPILNKNGNTSGTVALNANTWHKTAPITSIKVYNSNGYNLISGSTVTLYGIKAAATQFIPTKAVGGDIVVSDGTYAYHAFLSTGSFKPAQSLTADVLVVAGGGAGGSPDGWYGGGGGAGGLLAYTSQSLTATSYTVTVGAGGSGSTTVGGTNGGNNGNNSQFGALTASVGGGGGGNAQNAAGSSGGSGGGGVRNSGAGGSPTSGQGNSGGAASTSGGGGGGGGASAAGSIGNTSSPSNYQGGLGGAGSSTYSSWGAATGTGQNVSGTYYYAGGGGGCGAGAIVVPGGNGGGGQGAGWQVANTQATSGTANTGGGGGGVVGGATSTPNGMSGSGGSGIVIVRYTL